MGQCPRCGRKQLLSSGLCSNCSIAESNERVRRNIEAIRARLPKMFDENLWNVVNRRFGMSGLTEKDWSMIDKLIRNDRQQFILLTSKIESEKFLSGSYYSPDTKKTTQYYSNWEQTLEINYVSTVTWDNLASQMKACFDRVLSRAETYCTAEIAIRSGRYEDAAKAFEQLTLFEEAGRVRKMALQERNTSRNVSVNMNQLLDQVRNGGLALAYKCPSCGGSIKIDKDFDPGMRVCGYCGTPLDTTVIATMLKNI